MITDSLPDSPIEGAHILLGVSGGIAAYKAADIASKLVQLGAHVTVALTENGSRFVGVATFEAITQQPVHTSVFAPWTQDWHGHISLGQRSDAIVVAPATAGVIARLANGMAEDMLGASVLASRCPLLIAPAMEESMYQHLATQQNIDTLRSRGGVVVGPESGRLASGDLGFGRMSEPATIVGAVRATLGLNGVLAGRKLVITAGGTREPIDPIRYIGNRSSGLMGYSIAQAAIDSGADVTLICGTTAPSAPYGAFVMNVETVADMKAAVDEAVTNADVLIMTAAVSDFRPANAFTSKIKKAEGNGRLSLHLETTEDILASIQRPNLIKIGFAAETADLESNAQKKISAKSLDLIVANDAVATIGSQTSKATLIEPDGTIERLPMMDKRELGRFLVARVSSLLDRRDEAG